MLPIYYFTVPYTGVSTLGDAPTADSISVAIDPVTKAWVAKDNQGNVIMPAIGSGYRYVSSFDIVGLPAVTPSVVTFAANTPQTVTTGPLILTVANLKSQAGWTAMGLDLTKYDAYVFFSMQGRNFATPASAAADGLVIFENTSTVQAESPVGGNSDVLNFKNNDFLAQQMAANAAFYFSANPCSPAIIQDVTVGNAITFSQSAYAVISTPQNITFTLDYFQLTATVYAAPK